MYAVIKTGGKQYQISQGNIIEVEKIEGEKGQEIVLDQVLMINSNNTTNIGNPVLSGVKVLANILEQGKSKKVVSFKHRRRKHFRKTTGHRQMFTKLKIARIVSGVEQKVEA